MSSVLEITIASYKEICKIPRVKSGKLSKKGDQAILQISQRNLATEGFEIYQLNVNFQTPEENLAVEQPVPIGYNGVNCSPSGTRQISFGHVGGRKIVNVNL